MENALKDVNQKLRRSDREKKIVERFGYDTYMAMHYAYMSKWYKSLIQIALMKHTCNWPSLLLSARLPDIRAGGGRYEVGTICTGSRLSDVRDGRDCWETCPSGWNRMEDAENRLIAEPAPIGTDRLEE